MVINNAQKIKRYTVFFIFNMRFEFNIFNIIGIRPYLKEYGVQ